LRPGWAAILILALAAPTAAQPLALDGNFVQGGLAQGRAAPGAGVVFEGRPLPVTRDGRFLIGFAHDAARAAKLIVAWPDGREELRQLEIGQRRYKVQRIDGLPKRKVTPEPRDLARIEADAALLKSARARATPDALSAGRFVWPARGSVSGVYGSRRILNGETRAPHLGLDIAAPVGTPVVAAADGVVSLVHPDMFFTGRTVMIDHGLGLSSIYIHMSAILVKDGERVTKGQAVGRIGATGRATGPHLHWGVAWFDVRLDPALLVGPMPK
jgi:murein DD-endopeptidase MepM/ murein hydrolase activator NlpD